MSRILVVDDSADARHLLRIVLEHAGYSVTEAENGAAAFEALRAERCDLVISDGLMPVMDGFRLCMEIRRSPDFASLPFIFHTASFTTPDDLLLASAMHADAYLLKPSEPGTILAAVEQALAGAGAGRETLRDRRLTEVLEQYGARIEHKLDEKVADLEAARALRDAYRALLDHIPALLMTLDLAGTPDFLNAEGRAFFGASDPKAVFDAVHPEDRALRDDLIASLLGDPRPLQTSLRIRRRGGAYHLIGVSARPYEGTGGVRIGFVITGTDMTAQEQHKELLLHAAEHDILTDLPTRHVFDRRFDEILRNVNKGARCALVFVDSIDVKAVNDRFGFDIGDATIANLARVIVDAVRPGDLVARLCATEFVVLAEDLGWDEAGDLARRIQTRVAASALVPSAPDHRVSVGIAINVVPDVPMSRGAETAGPAGRAPRTTIPLLEALQGPPALTFVPVYSLADGALVRCSVAYAYAVEERLVAGDELALGAAKHGVARRVGARVIEATLEQAHARKVPCSVELFVAAMLDPTVFEQTERAAERAGVDPRRLMFEVSTCGSRGMRPPAHWLQAARRSPIRLVHACGELTMPDMDPLPAESVAEVAIPLAVALDTAGMPRPTAVAAIEGWRSMGVDVSVTGITDRAVLPRLAKMGVTRASGDALAPAAGELERVIMTANVGGW